MTILKHLFPVPKPDSRRIMTFSNNEDFILFRHHTYSKGEGGEIVLKEIGPRFQLRRKLLIIWYPFVDHDFPCNRDNCFSFLHQTWDFGKS